MRGKPTAPPVAGTARLLPDSDGQVVLRRLSAKYGLVKHVYDLYMRADRMIRRRSEAPSAYIEFLPVAAPGS
jgi:hypothetical protein